jgi:DNA recombination protein RmuC
MSLSILADILTLLLLVVAIGLVWLRTRPGGQSEALLRLDARLDEQSRRLGLLEDRLAAQRVDTQEAAARLREELIRAFGELRESLQALLAEQGRRFEQRQTQAVHQLSELLQNGMTQQQKQVGEHLGRYSEELGKRIDSLTLKTDERLQQISGQVEKRLSEGFEKTTQTFGDILKRLAIIDEAQKRITELSSNVVSLQEVLADKRSRGAFGEVQLEALVRNVLPEQAFAFQKTLSNGKIADCVLSLPPPTGNVAIDAKFPLEAWRRMTDVSLGDQDRKTAERQFRQDIGKHITDISEKYILPGETSDGAILFIPAEAIFAEIHAHYPDLVEKAMQARVWMVSPTTLWATLNMARAVLKDAATREQVHIIQEHLTMLAKDFGRFEERMDNLARHIQQAGKDVDEVHKSARKISSRFQKIEQVELGKLDKDVTSAAISVDDPEQIP